MKLQPDLKRQRIFIKLIESIIKFSELRLIITFLCRQFGCKEIATSYQVCVAVYSIVAVESAATFTSNRAVRASRFSYLCVDLSILQLTRAGNFSSTKTVIASSFLFLSSILCVSRRIRRPCLLSSRVYSATTSKALPM